MVDVTRMRVGLIVEPSNAARDVPPEQVTPQQILNVFAVKPTVTFPTWTVWFFVIGLCALAGLSSSAPGGALVAALILIGIGATGVYASKAPLREYAARESLTERAFDNWIDYQSRLSITRACERIGIEKSDFEETGPDKVVIRPPTAIIGTLQSDLIPAHQRTSNLPGDKETKFAIVGSFVGTDGKRRWRVNRFIWLVPMQAYLSAYVCDVKILSVTTIDNRTQIATERNDEFAISDQVSQYFYQSVVGIISGQREIQNVGSSYYFKLSIENAESIEVNIAGDLSAEVKAFRTWINDYKQRLLHGGVPGGPPSQTLYPPTGYPPTGYPPAGAPMTYPPTGYPPAGYPQAGYPPTGYPPTGYPPTGYPPTAYPPTGYPPTGYPPTGYPSAGYPPAGAPMTYPPAGYPPASYPPSGPIPPGAFPASADTIPGLYPATPPPDPSSGAAPGAAEADGYLAPIYATPSTTEPPAPADASPEQPAE